MEAMEIFGTKGSCWWINLFSYLYLFPRQYFRTKEILFRNYAFKYREIDDNWYFIILLILARNNINTLFYFGSTFHQRRNTFERSLIADPSKYKDKHFQFLFPNLDNPRDGSFLTPVHPLSLSLPAEKKEKGKNQKSAAAVRRFLTAPPPITKWRDKRKWRRSTRRGVPRSGG